MHICGQISGTTRGEKRRSAYILDLRLDLDVRVDARDEVLYRPPQALVPGRVLPPRPAVVQREHGRVFRLRDLRRGAGYTAARDTPSQ